LVSGPSDERASGAKLGGLGRVRGGDLDHNVGAERLGGVIDERGARLLVGGVGNQRAQARSALHNDIDPLRVNQLPDHVGHERDPVLTGGCLLGDPDSHAARQAIGCAATTLGTLAYRPVGPASTGFRPRPKR